MVRRAWWWSWASAALVALAGGPASAADVALEAPVGAAVRNPGDAYSVIQPLLEARGHTVTIVDASQIDTLPEIQQFAAIVLSGSGYAVGHDLPLFDAVIEDYVDQGGGLVATGWVFYYNDAIVAPGLNAVAPVLPSMSFITNGTVDPADNHEIVEGLGSWANPSYDAYSGDHKPGALTISSNGGTPDGALWEVGGGRVVTLGPLFTAEYEAYATQALHDGSIPDATEMFLRAIDWAAQGGFPPGCGDGIVDAAAGELCDDGNHDNHDACVSPCVPATCGDHFVQTGIEPCDDGDDDNDDGCLVGCILPTCGDGFVYTGTEPCDDANTDDTDACLTGCIAASCGDGFLHAGVETCDDGNLDDGDDCPGSCQPAICGDGYVLQGVEVCDDGNADQTDACLVACVLPSCGDGFVHAGVEACDDGNDDDSDICVGTMCQLAACGDGFLHTGIEDCDDGNDVDDDGCTHCNVDAAASSSGGEGGSSEGGSSDGSSDGGSSGAASTTGGSDDGTTGETGVGSSGDGPQGSEGSGADDSGGSSGAPAVDDAGTGGCQCRSDGSGAASGPWWGLLAVALRRRRRRG